MRNEDLGSIKYIVKRYIVLLDDISANLSGVFASSSARSGSGITPQVTATKKACLWVAGGLIDTGRVAFG